MDAGSTQVLAGGKGCLRLDESGGLGALSRGSFGNVYIALDKSTGSAVIVKRQQAPSDVASTELAFYKALSQYSHPIVMPLLDHFIVPFGSKAYLYMVFDVMDTDLWTLWKIVGDYCQ